MLSGQDDFERQKSLYKLSIVHDKAVKVFWSSLVLIIFKENTPMSLEHEKDSSVMLKAGTT